MSYWDTSAIVKLYVSEPDSPYFLGLLVSTTEQLMSSAILMTELPCALYRKERAGDLKRGAARKVYRRFAADAESGRFLTIPYGRDIADEAQNLVRMASEQPRPLRVRSLDFIHVCSALVSGEKTMVATEKRLRKVAVLAGLTVLP